MKELAAGVLRLLTASTSQVWEGILPPRSAFFPPNPEEKALMSFAHVAKTIGSWGLGLAITLGACTAQDDAAPNKCSSGTSTTASSQQPVEWVSYHTEVPLVASDFHSLVSGLIGADAQAGKFSPETELAPGLFVKATQDPSTPDQARLTFAFNDGKNPRRTLAVAPASYAVGSVYVATVDAALARMQKDQNLSTAGGKFLIEYRVTSTQGGKLSFGVRGDEGKYSIVLDITSPQTSLLSGHIGQPAETGAPYDTVAGTVWFLNTTKDDFDYFVDHAYGEGATAQQNFSDFALVPYNWLRLTVDPHLDKKFVNVGFDVLTLDGKRVAVAKAPASILAGNEFQALVDRNMTNMLTQEQKTPGSSTPWQVPFFYDSPDGGGVVQVIASGAQGKFQLAYSIESPRHTLTDVPFVHYQPVKVPPPDPTANATCEQLGGTRASSGTLNITFTVSSVITSSPDLHVPLVGDIYCAVYHASDVAVSGPTPGATPLQSFTVPNANLQASTPPTFVTDAFPAGEYQILCAQDLDHSGGASKGDPVTLPVGGYKVECDKNPVTVEFALLDPQN